MLSWGWRFFFVLGCGQVGEEVADPGPAGLPDSVCQPSCEQRECGPNGCGGLCGICPAGASCTAEGQCVADCERSCADLGLECGTHCEEDCGTCTGPEEECEHGACVCRPACSAQTCEQPDGCGGVCGACPSESPSTDSPLRLAMLHKEINADGVVERAIVGVTYVPASDDAPAPVLADLRLLVEGPATLRRVGVGKAVMEADKELLRSVTTGRSWVERPDGQVQVLIYSPRRAHPIGAGLMLVYDFKLGEPGVVPTAPARFSLVPRENTFAPVNADATLWGTAVDTPLVLWAR